MAPKEIKALIKLLRSQGVIHYKTAEIELNLAPIVSRETKRRTKPHQSSEETEIKHKVEELTSLMKLSDVDLVNRMFPDHTKYEEAEESANDTN